MRVLVVEDDTELASILERALTEKLYAVELAHDGESARHLALVHDFALILLDVMIPGIDGVAVCHAIRQAGKLTPILMLTARDQVDDRILGLDAGADHYLIKPFEMGELFARVRAILRRSASRPTEVLRSGSLALDPRSSHVSIGPAKVDLTAKEFALLQFFMQHPNQILTRSEILENVWDSNYEGLGNVVDVYVNYLRNKLGCPQRIETVRGRGYLLREMSMSLTITQRLTLTCALLTALVLLPAIAGLYFMISANVEADGVAAVRESVNRLAHQTVKQLDEDILVDFRGQPVAYDGLNVAHDHWAVMRGCGQVECATGAFNSDLVPQLGAVPRVVRGSGGAWFRTASAVVVEDGGPKLEDLPETVRKEAVSRCADGVFLNAKSEISGNRNVVSVKFLKPDQIIEVQVSMDGRFIQKRSEGLPRELPSGLLPAEAGGSQRSTGTLSWTAHDGQLLAVLSVANAERAPVWRAANRLGEEFELGGDGMQVLRRLEGSRLYVVTALDISGELRKKDLALWVLCATGSVLWVLIALIGWYVTRRAMSPVDDIVNAVRRIEPSQMEARLPVAVIDDELSRIARTINGMLDRIEEGYRRERQFTGDASHELRGPLTKAKAEIDLALSQERASGEYRMTLGHVRRYTEFMQRLVESLLLLARLDTRSDPLVKDRFDLEEACFEVMNTFSEEDVKRVALEIGDGQSPIQVIAERRLIGVLLHNLVENALRYSLAAKPVRVRIRRQGAEAAVEIEDQGPGVDAAHAAHLFDRFYRVDQARTRESGGFGLGLSIVKAIADAHGITVGLASSAKGGTVARFSLPLAT